MNGVKILYLFFGELFNLKMFGYVDNGFVDLEVLIFWYIVVGMGVSYE